MQRRDADATDRVAVLGRRVADVLLEAPAGMRGGRSVHVAVAGDLGDHRGGGDRGAGPIAFDDGAMRHLAVGQREAVDQAGGSLSRLQPLQRAGERLDVGDVQSPPVDARARSG